MSHGFGPEPPDDELEELDDVEPELEPPDEEPPEELLDEDEDDEDDDVDPESLVVEPASAGVSVCEGGGSFTDCSGSVGAAV